MCSMLYARFRHRSVRYCTSVLDGACLVMKKKTWTECSAWRNTTDAFFKDVLGKDLFDFQPCHIPAVGAVRKVDVGKK